jgi:hypothetical protein
MSDAGVNSRASRRVQFCGLDRLSRLGLGQPFK